MSLIPIRTGLSTAVKIACCCFTIVLLSKSVSAQGPLTNGFTHSGTLSINEQEVWNFTAKSGEGIVVKLGAAVVGSSLYPRLRLYEPGGALLGESFGPAAAEVAARATNGGAFTVVVANAENFASGGSGAYRLTLAKTGTVVFVAPSDEGGPMTNGAVYIATNGVAGLDLWTFNACAGDGIVLQATELTGGTDFTPELRLYAPDGTLLNTASGATAARISRIAPMMGSYLLIVGDTAAGYGTYQLTGSGFATGFKLCPLQIEGANLIVSAVGGRPGSNYAIFATTDVAAPLNSWTPIRTNPLGTFGEFTLTNLFDAGNPQQYFRVRLP
jgi:hypothetical protein